jgi:hypothetical protein
MVSEYVTIAGIPNFNQRQKGGDMSDGQWQGDLGILKDNGLVPHRSLYMECVEELHGFT